MPRRPRYSFDTSFFHVMVQGVNKEYIFENDKFKERYLQMIKQKKGKLEIDIIAYVIMHNHAHLLLYTDNVRVLSEFMKGINEDYGRYYNYMENRVGHVFRNRFLSEPITSDKYLINCMAYIHNNPVKANIVQKCEDYKFSSYLEYINEKGIIDKKIIQLILGKDFFDIENFKYIHLKNEYYFLDCEETVEQNIKEIIIELENRYGCKIEKVVENPKILKKLVLEIKDRIKISNRNLAKILHVSRNKINQKMPLGTDPFGT